MAKQSNPFFEAYPSYDESGKMPLPPRTRVSNGNSEGMSSAAESETSLTYQLGSLQESSIASGTLSESSAHSNSTYARPHPSPPVTSLEMPIQPPQTHPSRPPPLPIDPPPPPPTQAKSQVPGPKLFKPGLPGSNGAERSPPVPPREPLLNPLPSPPPALKNENPTPQNPEVQAQPSNTEVAGPQSPLPDSDTSTVTGSGESSPSGQPNNIPESKTHEVDQSSEQQQSKGKPPELQVEFGTSTDPNKDKPGVRKKSLLKTIFGTISSKTSVPKNPRSNSKREPHDAAHSSHDPTVTQNDPAIFVALNREDRWNSAGGCRKPHNRIISREEYRDRVANEKLPVNMKALYMDSRQLPPRKHGEAFVLAQNVVGQLIENARANPSKLPKVELVVTEQQVEARATENYGSVRVLMNPLYYAGAQVVQWAGVSRVFPVENLTHVLLHPMDKRVVILITTRKAADRYNESDCHVYVLHDEIQVERFLHAVSLAFDKLVERNRNCVPTPMPTPNPNASSSSSNPQSAQVFPRPLSLGSDNASETSYGVTSFDSSISEEDVTPSARREYVSPYDLSLIRASIQSSANALPNERVQRATSEPTGVDLWQPSPTPLHSPVNYSTSQSSTIPRESTGPQVRAELLEANDEEVFNKNMLAHKSSIDLVEDLEPAPNNVLPNDQTSSGCVSNESTPSNTGFVAKQ